MKKLILFSFLAFLLFACETQDVDPIREGGRTVGVGQMSAEGGRTVGSGQNTVILDDDDDEEEEKKDVSTEE
ncbi:hypothetical protein [Sediminitomix flava]|uniref:Uncharacterized protein n=1 Tax=Sediminitomix flava TaxID=379075 RepID=A0A315ZCK5_SEDFL|nr:hypothetical protein [Sediminitomix flava]PWJ43271.1 hypothetical protein BC781_102820 [Sediminitomix flava]